MTRNEDKKAVADRWSFWGDLLQFGALALLLGSVFVLDAIPKETAKAIIWYWAGFMFILATAGWFVSRRALKYRMIYLNAEQQRVSGLFDKAINEVKKRERKNAR